VQHVSAAEGYAAPDRHQDHEAKAFDGSFPLSADLPRSYQRLAWEVVIVSHGTKFDSGIASSQVKPLELTDMNQYKIRVHSYVVRASVHVSCIGPCPSIQAA